MHNKALLKISFFFAGPKNSLQFSSIVYVTFI